MLLVKKKKKITLGPITVLVCFLSTGNVGFLTFSVKEQVSEIRVVILMWDYDIN